MRKLTATLRKMAKRDVTATDYNEAYSHITALSFLLPEFIDCKKRMTIIRKVTDLHLKGK